MSTVLAKTTLLFYRPHDMLWRFHDKQHRSTSMPDQPRPWVEEVCFEFGGEHKA